MLAGKRLLLADGNCAIQGYRDRVFRERNTLKLRNSVAAQGAGRNVHGWPAGWMSEV